MIDKSFKVKVYQLETQDVTQTGQIRFLGKTAFETAAERAHSESFADRCRLVRGKYRRLENYRNESDCSLLHFITSEFTGPGRFTIDQAVAPIDLAPDESFSHGTSMLYDHQTQLAFIESTLVGMGPKAIADYCELFVEDMTKYRLVPRLDEEASARARRHQTIRSVEMKANIGPITRADRDGGYGTIQAFGNGLEGETISVRVNVERTRRSSLSIPKVWELVEHAFGYTNEENAVTGFKVNGREHSSENLEEIDLIEHHESRERILKVDPTLRQVSYEDRWNALVEIRKDYIA